MEQTGLQKLSAPDATMLWFWEVAAHASQGIRMLTIRNGPDTAEGRWPQHQAGSQAEPSPPLQSERRALDPGTHTYMG